MANRKPGYYRIKTPAYGWKIGYWDGQTFEVRLTPYMSTWYGLEHHLTIDETPISPIAPAPKGIGRRIRSLITNPDFWVLVALIIFALIISKK